MKSFVSYLRETELPTQGDVIDFEMDETCVSTYVLESEGDYIVVAGDPESFKVFEGYNALEDLDEADEASKDQAIEEQGEYDNTETSDDDDVEDVNEELNSLRRTLGLDEAEYQGRKVKLNKPMQGDVKKFKVYVKDPKTGNVKKVNFGDPNMRIKKSNPARRKSFRARHNCDNPGPKTKARYWSCRKW
jgi:hypothetical protein